MWLVSILHTEPQAIQSLLRKIVICRLAQDATYRGIPIMAQLRTTLVFVQHQGQWQLAGLHECHLGQPPL
jgi:hypothetical protein